MNVKNILYAFVAILILSCSKDDEPQLSPAKFSIDQSTVDFGEVEIPTQKEIKLTVTNNGEEDLILKNYTFSGSNATEFTVRASETEETIQAGKTYEFSVIFKPTEEGSKTAILTIISNIGEHKVNISGKGTPEPVAIFNINPESKNFGDVEINTTAAINFTVANTGNAELVISEVTIEGANADTYNTPNNSITLQSNAATGIKVTFAPLSTGNKIATLSIATNVGTYTVNLEGNGIPDPNAIVNIPDANFKASLLAHGDSITGSDISIIDTNDDGEIQVSEAETYVGHINCSIKNINDLTGIEVFKNLKSLDISANELSTVDLSHNTALLYLLCSGNKLENIDVSPLTELRRLYIMNNQISDLNISNNTKLNILWSSGNPLSTLNISNNTSLTELYCDNNGLTNLNVSNQPYLRELNCAYNNLTNLDISTNPQLTDLNVTKNELVAIDISQNTSLIRLSISDNQITALNTSNHSSLEELNCINNKIENLDVSSNTALISLFCWNNQLSSLNVANGNNSSMTYMKAQNNSNLTCIKIDEGFNPADYNYLYWDKDDTASYSNSSCP